MLVPASTRLRTEWQYACHERRCLLIYRMLPTNPCQEAEYFVRLGRSLSLAARRCALSAKHKSFVQCHVVKNNCCTL